VSRGRFLPPTIINIVIGVFRISLSYMLVVEKQPLQAFALVFPISSLLGFALYVSIFYKENKFSLRNLVLTLKKTITLIDFGFMWSELKKSNVFAYSRILYTVIWQSDILLISIFFEVGEIGYYGAANITIVLFLFVLSAFQEALFPYLSRLFIENKPGFWDLLPQLAKMVGIIILPFAVFSSYYLDDLLLFFFGYEFFNSIRIANLLLWSSMLYFFEVINSCYIAIVGKMQTLVKVLLITNLIYILLSLYLIPQFGAYGAALSKFLSICLIVLINAFIIHFRSQNQPWLTTLVKLFTSSFLMWATIQWPIISNQFLNVLLSIIVFNLSLFIMGVIRKTEISNLYRKIKSPMMKLFF
jgi:O-antigen/teichoic acid export membrane protein